MTLPTPPELERMIGKIEADRMMADARQLGLVASQAVGCGIREQSWLTSVQAGAIQADLTRLIRIARDSDNPMAVTVQIQANFIAALPAGIRQGQQLKKESACANLGTNDKLRRADQLARTRPMG